MPLLIFNTLEEKDKAKAIENLISSSTPSQAFFFMIILSVLMATFGILIDSVAIIIGSMLIAPMLYPIISLGLGITLSDGNLVSRSLQTTLKSLGFGIVAAAVATLFFSTDDQDLPALFIASAQPSLLYLAVAIVAGFAASYSLVKPQINEALPGVAISVALIPPIAVIGIGLAYLDWSIMNGAFLLFLVNMLGIVFASMLTFSLMNFYVKRKVAEQTVKEEDKKIEDEKKKAEKEIAKKNGNSKKTV